MIKIKSMHAATGRVAATFTAVVGEVGLPGCALIRCGEGYSLSLPRVGEKGDTRPVVMGVTEAAELLRSAVSFYESLAVGRSCMAAENDALEMAGF